MLLNLRPQYISHSSSSLLAPILKSFVSIKISAFNKVFFLFLLHKLRLLRIQYLLIGLPKKTKRFTILRSPFVNKTSRVHLGFKKRSVIILLKLSGLKLKNKLDGSLFDNCSFDYAFYYFITKQIFRRLLTAKIATSSIKLVKKALFF